jgi:hypothetical protein
VVGDEAVGEVAARPHRLLRDRRYAVHVAAQGEAVPVLLMLEVCYV